MNGTEAVPFNLVETESTLRFSGADIRLWFKGTRTVAFPCFKADSQRKLCLASAHYDGVLFALHDWSLHMLCPPGKEL